MVDDRLRLQVFVASPSDTRAERNAMHAIIEELNLGVADSRGIVLELVEWETHSWPGVGLDAQDVINHQIDAPDIAIGIFWKRLGTETGRAASGSVEEIENALELRAAGHAIEVLVYFNEQSYFPRAEELDQVAGVFNFRRQLASRGLLTASYQGLEDFKSKVRVHLTQVIRRWSVGRAFRVTPAQGFRAVREAADDRASWRSKAAAGRLSVEISSLLGGEAYALVSAVIEAMREKGFEARTGEKVAVAVMELLGNVARHAEGAAQVDIEVNSLYFKHVNISVTSRGQRFEVEQALEYDLRSLEAGDREHGLLRVARLSCGLRCVLGEVRGTVSVKCEVHEPRRPDLAMFDMPGLAPIVHNYSAPEVLWVDGESYSYTAYNLLKYDSPKLREAFFGPLEELGAGWLGIGYTGRDQSTGTWVDPLIVERAIERYFAPEFESRRVLVLAHNTDYGDTERAKRWAAAHEFEFFTSEGSFARRAAKLGLS